MSITPEQFTGTPLVAGEVLGVRAWDVDSLGRIKSPSFKHIWTPGENVAACQKDAAPRWAISVPGSMLVPSSGIVTFPTYTSFFDTEDRRATADYVDFAKRHFPGWTLTGVVYEQRADGYLFELERDRDRSGKRLKRPQRTKEMVVGELVRQFEAEKPKPEPPPPPPHDFADCTCGFYAYLNGTNDYADHHVIGVVRGYGETFLGTRGFRSAKARIIAAYSSTHADVERVRPLPVSRERMRELYPDVAWFDDYAAMVAEFPPSDPEPTPETDPEFWTRSA